MALACACQGGELDPASHVAATANGRLEVIIHHQCLEGTTGATEERDSRQGENGRTSSSQAVAYRVGVEGARP